MYCTNDVDMSDLADHRFAVYLTHVSAGIFSLNSTDMKMPSSLMIVTDAESSNSSHYLTVDCQDHLPIEVNPCDL